MIFMEPESEHSSASAAEGFALAGGRVTNFSIDRGDPDEGGVGVFNRQIRDDQRVGILAKLKNYLNLQSQVPSDFTGIPVLNNLKSWFFSYGESRNPNDIPCLWRMFELALRDDSINDDAFSTTFNEAVSVRGVNINLTMGLFWVRPYKYLSLDGNNRSYLGVDLPAGGLTAQFYVDFLRNAARRKEPFPEISYLAWKAGDKRLSIGSNVEANPSVIGDRSYWLVGAYWDSKDPQDQTLRFLAEGIWENGYEERFGDDVKAMKVGDMIAIKATFTQRKNLPFDAQERTVSRMDIKAIGTIVANRGDGRIIEVEWNTDFQPRSWYFYTGRPTVWKLRTDTNYRHSSLSKQLIDFVWYGKDQDYEFFCNMWWGTGEDRPGNYAPQPAAQVPIAVGEPTLVSRPYSIEDISASGIFLEESQLQMILERLRSKKALILQGAPGVGKTFIARKLAYALMAEEAPERLEMVQFHQSYSYDDFVRGYRPVEGRPGTFGLQDGIFHEFCRKAANNPDDKYVFIVDEINRGNLSLIFGELLMLIEADKRGSEFAVPLVYRKENEPRFFIPSNVYLIGLMNLADRSLAMVDYALRRRFAFYTLHPQYKSSIFRQWLTDRLMSPQLIGLIAERLIALNDDISADPLLGENYQVGHSYFCPKGDDFAGLDHAWYEGIVETEIAPLLREYWFDNPPRATEAIAKLLANLP